MPAPTAKTTPLVWEGVATSRLSKDAIANPGPGIDAAVARIFANFPNPPDKK